MRAEWNNMLLRVTRRRYADHIIYQSVFAREWWEREAGPTPVDFSIIHNGVPLDIYSPEGEGRPPTDREVILMVEGNIGGGYEVGVKMGVQLLRELRGKFGRSADLQVAGHAREIVKKRFESGTSPSPRWLGLVPAEKIPSLYRSAHLLFSGDPNPACPNAVIEAMACGLPVIAFDTGAIAEIVRDDAGEVVDYGGDPWRLEEPDIPSLAQAAVSVLEERSRFKNGARARAEKAFSLEAMVEGYLQAVGKVLG
jgi:glycosyltransferase involved in cell wall biosynthesis